MFFLFNNQHFCRNSGERHEEKNGEVELLRNQLRALEEAKSLCKQLFQILTKHSLFNIQIMKKKNKIKSFTVLMIFFIFYENYLIKCSLFIFIS